jgi:hypothetical protein
VKYVYKINSSYDGFVPSRIRDRMLDSTLVLGWRRYVDSVDLGDEIWVYFLGPHRFENGVYARGIAESIDYEEMRVELRVQEYQTDKPLTDALVAAQIANVVATRYQQVFVLPDELDVAPTCTLSSKADSCKARLCGSCPTWKQLPTVDRRNLLTPYRLDGHVDRYAPGFWVIPSRSYLYQAGRIARRGIRRSSEMFYRFKTGEEALAYPLALAAHKALAKAQRLDFDALVPVPLSPDKEAAGELNRTLALATELGRLLGGVPVRRSWLWLDQPLSKKRLRVQRGLTASQFETAYWNALQTSPAVTGSSILLVDDVCTDGSTFRVCADALAASGRAIVAATGGQMAVKKYVRNPDSLCQP